MRCNYFNPFSTFREKFVLVLLSKTKQVTISVNNVLEPTKIFLRRLNRQRHFPKQKQKISDCVSPDLQVKEIKYS